MSKNIPQLFSLFPELWSQALKDFGSLHPLIVHFPIVALSFSPFFFVIALINKTRSKTYFSLAYIHMTIGTIGLFFAIKSGNDAAEPLTVDPSFVPTLNKHVTLSEEARFIFVLLLIVITIVQFWKNLKPHPLFHRYQKLYLLLISIVYIYGFLLLSNAVHYGGKLVHYHGIHSTLYEKNPHK